MKCLLDLDGVLTDFMSAAHQFHGLPYSYEDYPYPLGEWDCLPPATANMTPQEFWGRLGADFWANLPWMPDGKAILCLLETYFGPENICLLSSPTGLAESVSGKVRWIQQNMPEYRRRFLIGPTKHFCAHRGVVLIDDADHNVTSFGEYGGLAVLVPRKWNTGRGNPTLETIETRICAAKGVFDE